MRKISIAIPTWQRHEMTINSFIKVLDDERIREIVIVDDASTDGSYEKLYESISGREESKIKLLQNKENIDCYRNKREAMMNTTSEFSILLDSDNVIDKSYLDAIYALPEWDKNTFCLPDFARPHFSAKKWSGLTITKHNVAQYADTNLMTNLNAMNFFINREEYLRVWDGSVNPITSDSIYFSYCWLVAENRILVTPNLQYDHYVAKDNSGHYQTHSHKAVGFHKQLMEKIKQLR